MPKTITRSKANGGMILCIITFIILPYLIKVLLLFQLVCQRLRNLKLVKVYCCDCVSLHYILIKVLLLCQRLQDLRLVKVCIVVFVCHYVVSRIHSHYLLLIVFCHYD